VQTGAGLTGELRPGLPRGLWYAIGLNLRTVSSGARPNEQEAAIIYDGPDGALAVATFFRTKDWVDRDDLATFELWLDREGVRRDMPVPFDDTLRVGATVVLRTRFVVGVEVSADLLRDSNLDSTELLDQLERRLSSL
jgi:hypothetical protein